jgi:hypothetical protein
MHQQLQYQKGDYIVYCSEFECFVYKFNTDVKLDSDKYISLFKGTSQEADEIIQLQGILARLEDTTDTDNSQRIDLLKSNIRMMCLKLKLNTSN